MNLDLEFQRANSRIMDFINKRWSQYYTQREIERCEELGIFPMYTTGCLTHELNKLHHITQVLPKYKTMYDKFLKTGKI